MEKDALVFRVKGKGWKPFSFFLIGGYCGVAIVNIYLQRSFLESIPSLVGFTIGSFLFLLIWRVFKPYDIVITPEHLTGPVNGFIPFKREEIPISMIDVAASQVPSLCRGPGYIKLQGRKRMVRLYFSATEAQAILDEILKRQQ